jgi:hypothetical protein
MSVTTYTEYSEAKDALDLAAQTRYEATYARYTECHDDAQKKYNDTVDALNAALPAAPTPEEVEAFNDAVATAADTLEQRETDCKNAKDAENAATSADHQAGLERLQQEASASLAWVPRLIITLDELQPAAATLQGLSWFDNHTATTTAPILTVSSLDDLRHELARDHGMFELLLMVRAEDGALAFGTDRRTISEIVSDIQRPDALYVQEIVHLRGELTGTAPNDTDSLRKFGTPSILSNWTVNVPPCTLSDIRPANATLLVDTEQQFTANGFNVAHVHWTTSPGGSPATGNGPTFTTKWTTPGTKQVTAACGSSTVNTTVVVAAVTGVLAPLDNFAGRSRTRFGVGEVIDLSFASTPPRTAVDFGGLRWSIDSGGGSFPGATGNDGLGQYIAPPTADTVRLVLKVVSGPSAGKTAATRQITIVAPNDALMVQKAGTGIQHTTGTWSVGFKGEIFLRPKNVSFQFMMWGEGTVPAVATGYCTVFAGLIHPVGPPLTVGPGDATNGCKVNAEDTVKSGQAGPPFGVGDFLWAIPWEFSVSGSPRTAFTTANHHATADAVGTATIAKKGAGPFSRVPSDPTSTF